ncbi:major facilitator superfamily transporter [Lophiotrema nucula]|uniref:Major facilitator superfamily transporter n=1 Tax=Lophiotrema nucula TaxID=690887 RepID=A0A6A5YND4_9PLEO|nr:major facilitator superfamily transporter [Lophiotrema nucula]
MPDDREGTQYHMSGLKLYVIVLALCLSVILVALDNAILATAIPTITSAFDSLRDVGWYGSAFLISICAFQPLTGKIYQQFSLKLAYLIFLFIFELGSLTCALSPSSVVLILGRALAGAGASGLFSGALVIIAHCIPLNLRPIYTGIIASMFGIANVVGPILGGAITQHLNWRWCFWINLPCGLAAAILLFLLFNPPTRLDQQLSTRDKILALDLPSFVLFVPATVMFLLALHWAGTGFSWSSARVVGLLCGSAVMIAVFTAWQWREGDRASIPPKVIGQRTVMCCAIVALIAMGSLQLTIYYLPMWFQVIKGVSPTKSGVLYLPTVAGDIALSILGGLFTTKVGYYNPILLVGCICVAVGGGLLTTLTVNVRSAKMIGFQILLGSGFGAIIQTPLIAVQAVLPLSQVPTATSVLVLCQFLGGSIFLSVASTVFESRLATFLSRDLSPTAAEAIISSGARDLRNMVSAANLLIIRVAYNDAISTAFWVVMASGAVALLASLGMQWRSVKGVKLQIG